MTKEDMHFLFDYVTTKFSFVVIGQSWSRGMISHGHYLLIECPRATIRR